MCVNVHMKHSLRCTFNVSAEYSAESKSILFNSGCGDIVAVIGTYYAMNALEAYMYTVSSKLIDKNVNYT